MGIIGKTALSRRSLFARAPMAAAAAPMAARSMATSLSEMTISDKAAGAGYSFGSATPYNDVCDADFYANRRRHLEECLSGTQQNPNPGPRELNYQTVGIHYESMRSMSPAARHAFMRKRIEEADLALNKWRWAEELKDVIKNQSLGSLAKKALLG